MTSPYSTIAPFFGGKPESWIPQDEAQRIQAYAAYEDIYWNNPNAFRLVQRGSEDNPIYVPSARVIVETINRYVARDMDFKVMPEFGSDQEKADAQMALTALFNRERWWSRFASAKRFGIIRGDWIFHITANPEKAEGTRISVTILDPRKLFLITDPDDVENVIGCDIAESVVIGDKTFIKRHRYLKTETGTISSEVLVVEADENWNTDKPKVATGSGVSDLNMPLTELPAEITALPIYHIKNFDEPHNPYGSSELRGLERLIAAVNQGISDEEVTLAMEGLGAYATTAGAPVDENDNEVPWRLGPGRVIELPDGTTFNRVNGVNTVGPFMDHLKYLHQQIDLGSGASSIAKGDVDVSVAESGIALALRFAPILDLAAEKDILIKDVMRQFIFDLRAWFKVYESTNMDNVLFDVFMGPKLPRDRDKEAEFWSSLFDRGAISMGTYHVKLRELGFDIPEQEMLTIVEEQNALAEAGGGSNDPTQADMAAEAGGATTLDE